MKNRFSRYMMLGIAALGMLGVALMPVSGQLSNAGAKGAKGKGKGKGKAGDPVPKLGTIELNQPNFGGTGVWSVPYITNMSDYITAGALDPCVEFKNGPDNGTVFSCAPFNKLGAEVFSERRASDSGTDPEGACLPPGVPRMMYTPYPMKMIQEPKAITFIFEGGAHIWRHIPLVANKDAVKHTPMDRMNPTYVGEGIGYWEGDTLAIDVSGFNTRTWLDFAGHPHGEKLHVIERYTRLDTNTLEYSATIDDPEFYTRPWTVVTTATYQPTNQLLEYICQENERDSDHNEEMLRKRGIDPSKIR